INKKPLKIEVYYLEDRQFLKEEINLINDIGKRLGVFLEQMETEQKLKESNENIGILNESFLKFSDDPLANIQLLVETVGSLLNADNALYNRIIEKNGKQILKTLAIYKEPPGYERENDPLGHICTDVIGQNKDKLIIIKDLDKTKYGKSDPGVKEFNLKQYCGIAIRLDNKPVGSFCLVYTKNRNLSEIDKNIIKLLSRSVSIEEQRWNAQQKLKKSEKSLLKSQKELSIRNQISNIFLTTPDDEMYSEVLSVVLNALESEVGYFGYINEDGDLVCPSLTRDVWDKCKIPDKNIIFPRDSWGGIWGESLEQKKIIISKGPFNLPKGHVSLKNILCVPIIHLDILVGQIVVGNSPNSYSSVERALLENIANFLSPILFLRLERKRHDNERRAVEKRLKKSEYKLSERVNELNCLYGLSKLVEVPDISMEEVIEKVLDLIPPAWQFPEITCARIIYKNSEFKTANFVKTKWSQKANIKEGEETIGSVEVYYLKKMPKFDEGPFLKEEKDLINGFAEILGGFFQRKKVELSISRLNLELEQKVIERTEKLKESEQKFRGIFEAIPDLYFLISKDGMYLDFSGDESKLFSSPKKFLGKNVRDIMPKENAKQTMKAIEKTLITKKPTTFEYTLPINNENRHYEARYLYSSEEKVSVFIRDITDRKITEMKLKKSEEKFRKMINDLDFGYYNITYNGKIVFHNP
ncbi:hypothetical protein LCGC14_2068370, partial [marine sediment metagenome]